MATPTLEQARVKASTVPGSRFSAFIYDPLLWWAERAGMADRRRRLVGRARGSVLEVGAGTGLNLEHYPDTVDQLVLAEPEPHMAGRLERRRERLQRPTEIVPAPAEALPFDDASFDTVVSTMVLCTVEDPGRALEEIRRVLAPRGFLLFLEHVRSDDPRLAAWQERLQKVWKAFADGCDCTRQTVETMRHAGFEVTIAERAEWRRMPPVVRPLVAGLATPT